MPPLQTMLCKTRGEKKDGNQKTVEAECAPKGVNSAVRIVIVRIVGTIRTIKKTLGHGENIMPPLQTMLCKTRGERKKRRKPKNNFISGPQWTAIMLLMLLNQLTQLIQQHKRLTNRA